MNERRSTVLQLQTSDLKVVST